VTPDEWRRVGEVFDRVVDLPSDEQQTVLLRTCQDHALRREVERMLGAHSAPGVLDATLAPILTAALHGTGSPLELGDWVGPYQVRREIARGGMGVVYEAHDPRLDRLVALKCLPPALQASPAAKAQFLAEARAAAALDHANICTVYDIADDASGGLFIAMAFYEGRTLQACLTGGPLAVADAIVIAMQVANGLESAHQAGVVHRDIKPSNVIWTARGEAKILDFGIAQLGGDPLSSHAGTPHYMSPEQVRGEPFDHRTDLWSLGVVLYQMLAGTVPFGGSDPRDALQAILDRQPVPIAERRPGTPPALAAIVRRLLQKRPDDRFQSANELRAALAAVQPAGARAQPPNTSARGRLPAMLTSFVGREQELASVTRLLETHRLVTLTGPGGTGKTRLAVELARRLGPAFGDGVCFVALAAVSDPGLVVSVVAEALGALPDAGRQVLESLTETIGASRMLLVLDNCEQVVDGVTMIPALLAACPSTHVLATSRVPLRLDGEQQFPVPPLPVPAPHHPDAQRRSTEADALTLFIDRARAADPAFDAGPETLQVLGDLCRRLDGLPLAIELAAANLKLFPPRQMLARLESRFQMLGRGGRDRPSRHRSLRAAIAWSYDLLSPDEQLVFRGLGAFVGGCTLEEAEAVCTAVAGHACPVLDALATLIDHSLLRRDDGEGGVRFGMLESIRAFAVECLDATGEAERARGAHAVIFLGLAEAAEREIVGPRQKEWLDRVQAEHDNMRAAMVWSAKSGHTDLALRFGAALWRFWLARGHLAEGRARLESLSVHAPDAPVALRVRVQNGLATLLHSEGRIREAWTVLQETLEISRAHAHDTGTALLLNNRAWVASELSDLDAAETLGREALQANRLVADTRGVGLALNNLGWTAMYRGRFKEARQWHAEGLDVRRAIGDRRGVAFALSNMAWCDAWLGEHERSRATLQESMGVLLDVSDQLLLGWASVVEGVGRYLRGAFEEAAASLERARRGWAEGGNKSVLAASVLYLGLVHAAQRDTDRAASALDAALRTYRDIGTTWGIAGTLLGMGLVACERSEHERAVMLIDESLAMRRAAGSDHGIAECFEVTAQVRLAAGDLRGAGDLLAEAQRIRAELGTPLPAWRRARLVAAGWAS
jgi:non-specific serine/threonine protein kinase